MVESRDMKTKNTYTIPIDLNKVTKTAKEGIAHVGDLIHSIDYDAPEGTLVLAALDGQILFVKDDSDRGGDNPEFEQDGNYIEILHKNNEVSEYEHIRCRSARVKVGDSVKAGQIIAEVGNTGWSECPHLHFMVYPKGNEYKTLEINFTSNLPNMSDDTSATPLKENTQLKINLKNTKQKITDLKILTKILDDLKITIIKKNL